MRALLALLCLAAASFAQTITAPKYEECMLAAVFPAGGRQGQTVTVELLAGNGGNFSDARDVLIDGPAGIAVKSVKNLGPNRVEATLAIAANAVPGRRCIRVLSDRSGLSNMLYFSVGRLPEVIEKEPNNALDAAESVTLPVVVNGRVTPQADVDCFRFALKKGQRLAAAVLAHSLDSHGQGRNYGIVDANLQILDDRGGVVAEAGDTLGLDPQLEFVAPADGKYVARVNLEAFEGFPQAVYRLVLGEVSLATSIFPPGGQRGTTTTVELAGPNVKPGTNQKVVIPKEDRFPLRHVVPEGEQAADLELPFLCGDLPERLEKEPNQLPAQATPLEVPMTVNGRIDQSGDVDWYRLRLSAGQAVCLEVVAQRFLRSPIDTLIQVHDADGKKLAENDDGFSLDYISMHDFRVMDSRLVFTAKTAGDYLVRISDQSGNGGPRAVYRLSATPARPNFELYLFPDGVPVWGPGSTAALLVKVNRFDNLDDDITLSIEGLPTGWVGSETVSRSHQSKPRQNPVPYHFLTITAPGKAKPGDLTSFRVVGRAKVKGETVERVALPLTLYYTSDTGFFRITPQARVVVARAQTPWLSSPVKSLTSKAGATIDIPTQVHDAAKLDRIDLVANLATAGVATAMAVPTTVPVKDGKAVLSLKLGENIQPGRHGITVSLRWRSDIRIGMPGPCVPLIALDVTP